jgi:hypothetical protein
MPCNEIEELRNQANDMNRQLVEQRQKARAFGQRSDYEWFLQRKIQRLVNQISQHVAKHRCQS